jgi:hypothetical protein
MVPLSASVPWRGGNRGNRFTGPGAKEGSRGAREDRITRIERGPGKAKSRASEGPGKAKLRAPEGPWKVVYGCDPAVSGSHPGKCNKAHIAIK